MKMIKVTVTMCNSGKTSQNSVRTFQSLRKKLLLPAKYCRGAVGLSSAALLAVQQQNRGTRRREDPPLMLLLLNKRKFP